MSRYFPERVLNEKGHPKKRIEGLKLDGTIKCLCCSKTIEPLDPKETYQHHCTECGHEEPGKLSEVQNVNCKDSISAKVHAGYGSDYDTCSFVIAICDDCIEESLKSGKIQYVGRYM